MTTDDGKIECMATRGVHDMLQYRVNLSHAHRIAQSNVITIEVVKVPIALQIDGEAWILEEPVNLHVRLKDKIPTVIGYATPRGVESWLQASLDDPHIRKAKESFRERMKQKYHIVIEEEKEKSNNNNNNNANGAMSNSTTPIPKSPRLSANNGTGRGTKENTPSKSPDSKQSNGSTNDKEKDKPIASITSLFGWGDFLAFGAQNDTNENMNRNKSISPPSKNSNQSSNDNNNNNNNNNNSNNSNDNNKSNNTTSTTITKQNTSQTTGTALSASPKTGDAPSTTIDENKKKEPLPIDAFFRQIFGGLKSPSSKDNNNSNNNNTNDNAAKSKSPPKADIDMKQNIGSSDNDSETMSRPNLSKTNSNTTAPNDDDPEMDLDIEEFLKLLPPESSKETKSNLVLSKKKDGLFLDKFAWWKVTKARNQGVSMDAESVVDAAKSEQALHHRHNSERANRSMSVIHNSKPSY